MRILLFMVFDFPVSHFKFSILNFQFPIQH